MIRALAVWLALCLGVAAQAQGLTGLARALPEETRINDRRSGVEITLGLTQGVPFRVEVIADPARLILSFAEVDFSPLSPDAVLGKPGRISALRFAAGAPGWSQMIADLSGPMLPEDVAMEVDPDTGRAALSLRLVEVNAAKFAEMAIAGTPAQAPSNRSENKPFTVVLDPGHGGKDPGAEEGGLIEKEIVLQFAREVRDLLRRDGVRAVLTRDADVFLSLRKRVALAHEVGADLFVSIHADTVREGQAEGATVYTLSEEASDKASAELVATQNRRAILSGADLSGADDEVTGVLLDMARRETRPRTQALSDAIVAQMTGAGGPMNRHPQRAGGFLVLKSADIPSVLLEIGFLSSQQDRRNLADPVWRSVIAQAVAEAILNWRDGDAARKGLVRQ